MENFKHYIVSFFNGLVSLLKGMRITGIHFFRRKVTEQYPENRATLKMFDRFRGTLSLVQDEAGKNKCIACGICQMNCPNGTLAITSSKVVNEEGKTVRILEKYDYDLGSCTYCQLCVKTCPHDALVFETKFEHAVFTREKLVKQLNTQYKPEEK